MTTRDSPILWWGVNLAVLWSAVGLALKWRSWRRGVEEEAPGWSPGQAYLLLLWFLPLCPWIFTNRDSYIYHYLPSYVFGLVLFGGLASMLPSPRLRLALVSLIAAVFLFCVRVWVKVPIDAGSLLHRLFF